VTRLFLLFLFALLTPFGAVSGAQTANLVAVGNLVNPRGIAFDADGALIVAEAGAGGEQISGEVPAPVGPYAGGTTGQVSRVEDGCPSPVATGLPSARGAGGEALGPSAVAVIGDRIFVLVAGGGGAHGNPDQPAGIYEVTSGSPSLLADLGAWLRANPVEQPPEDDLDPDGVWFGMVADAAGEALWVTESNSEQIARVSLSGEIARVADLSTDDQVPTAIAAGPDGSLFVGNFTSEPFSAGRASVIRVQPDGTTETAWTGLTMVTGLAVDGEGRLYAAEFSGGRDEPPYFEPGTGRIVRQTGADSLEEVATQVNLPGGIAFGLDGVLYVTSPTVGADGGTGMVLRLDLGQSLPISLGTMQLSPPSCGGTEPVTTIRVSDLGFDPPSLTIAAGTTVTWRNTGEFDHAVTSGPDSPEQWDSGEIRPGEEFSRTFPEPGTYPYYDGLFPDHTGTIEVIEAT
jgi:plastocyanin